MLETVWDETVRVTVLGVLGVLGSAVLFYLRKAWLLIRVLVAEFKPNGGTSVRDQLNRLERQVSTIAAFQYAVADSDPEPQFRVDQNGLYVSANRALQALVGRSESGFLGSEWETAVCEHDRERVWNDWCDAINRDRTFECQFTVCGASGVLYDVDCIATPIRAANAVTGWFGRYRRVEKAAPSAIAATA
jgi:PAS domain S-box-containing protein